MCLISRKYRTWGRIWAERSGTPCAWRVAPMSLLRVKLSAVSTCPALPPCTSGPSHADSCVLGHVHTALLVLPRLHTHSLGDMLPSTPILRRGRRLSTEGAGLTHLPADGTCEPDGVVTVPSLSLVSDPCPGSAPGLTGRGLSSARGPHTPQRAVDRPACCSPCRPWPLETELKHEPQPGAFFFNF